MRPSSSPKTFLGGLPGTAKMFKRTTPALLLPGGVRGLSGD
jgi:hypothetical protein